MTLATAPNAAVPAGTRKHAEDDAGHAAGVVCISPRGRVLLLHRSPEEKNYGGHWSLPGGGVDPDETAEDGARREMQEEAGYTAKGTFKLLSMNQTPTGLVFHTFLHKPKDEFVPNLNDEHTGFTWADLSLLPAPLHPAVEKTLAQIGSQDMAEDRSIRELDIDGRMHIRDVNVCMESVSPYRGGEIPGWNALGLKEDEIYQVYRPGAELSRPETIASANGIPFLRRHVAVSADDHKHMDTIGTTGTTARWEAPFIKNDLAVWVGDDIDVIEDKTRAHLSPGYRYEPVIENGTFNGAKYQIRMTKILFNHLASVHQGRQGPDVAIDSSQELQWHLIEQAILSI